MQDSGERFPQGVRCFGIGGPDEPGIDVGGRADLRMAQASGHRGDGHMGSDQQRSVGMSQAVESYRRQVVLAQEAREPACQARRVDGPAIPFGKQQIIVHRLAHDLHCAPPFGADAQPFTKLPLLIIFQQPDPAAANAMQAAEDAIFQEQLHAALEEALHKLTEREQAVIRGKYYAGKTVRQISEEQGLTISQVNTAKTSTFSKLSRNPRLMRWREETIQQRAWHGTGFSAWYAGGSVEERTIEYLESKGAYIAEECPAGEVVPGQ